MAILFALVLLNGCTRCAIVEAWQEEPVSGCMVEVNEGWQKVDEVPQKLVTMLKAIEMPKLEDSPSALTRAGWLRWDAGRYEYCQEFYAPGAGSVMDTVIFEHSARGWRTDGVKTHASEKIVVSTQP